ncbi:MAG: type II toxin-antitoxin system RelE/ParE family toxin [Verrucomicrobiota bacterium]
MKIRIQPSAKQDIRRGYRFYEQRESGLGSYFSDSIYSSIDSLQLYAGIHRMRGPFYRFHARPFPFWIYYRIDQSACFIVAVLDARQNLETIQRIEQSRGGNG